MSDLANTIDSVVTTLRQVGTALQSNSTDFNECPFDEWKNRWNRMLLKSECLVEAKYDIVRRNQCFECLKKFPGCSIGNTSVDLALPTINYCRTSISAADVRHYLMVGYLSSAWSVYDVLYDYVTRMLGAGSVFDNDSPGANKKLSEVFDPNKKNKSQTLGAFEKLFEKYWAIHKVSYVIRNSFVHEGGRINGEKVLRGTFERDYFEISQKTKDFFKNCGVDEASPPDSILSNTELDGGDPLVLSVAVPGAVNVYPWYNSDVRVILYHYNAKIDDLMSHMLVYAANGLKAHINQCFSTPMNIPDARIIL